MITNNDYLNSINEFIEHIINNKLNDNQIYSLLASYGIKNGEYNKDVSKTMENISYQVRQIYTDYMENRDPLDEKYKVPQYNVVDQGKTKTSFRHINVCFDPSKNEGSRNMYKLYIPIKYESLGDTVPSIYKFMFDNQISFESKISTAVRAEMFIIRTYNREDALRVIDYCYNTKINEVKISDNYTCTNPFIDHVLGVGIAQDTYGHSYNSFLSEMLYEYSQKPKLNDNNNYAEDFYQMVAQKYGESKSPTIRFMIGALERELRSIINNENILINMPKPIEIQFDPNFFYQYSRGHDGVSYLYRDKKGNIINENTNYDLYVKLQAQNCLHKMYVEKSGKSPEGSFNLAKSIVNQISFNLDYMVDGNYVEVNKLNIKCNYKDDKVAELIPYLYAQIAKDNKECNSYNQSQIIRNIKENTVSKIADDKNIGGQTYSINKATFKSSIDPIQTSEGLVGIEFVNLQNIDTVIANITIIKGNRLKRYNNVLIDLDNELISNKEDELGKIYRTEVAKILLDEARNERMIKEREGSFGYIRIDRNNKRISKMYDPEAIKDIYYLRKQKIINDVEQEEIMLESKQL